MPKARTIEIELLAEMRDLKRKLEEAQDHLNKTENKFKKFGQTLKRLFVGGAIVLGIKSITSAAIDAGETASKFGVVFSNQTKQAAAAVEDLRTNYGLAKVSSQDLLSETGDLLTGFGFTQEAALKLSERATKLAVDLASLKNVKGGTAEATKALSSLMLGEGERAKMLGIVVRQNSKEYQYQVKRLQEAEGMTLTQAKAVAALDEAYKQSKNAVGDYARTSDSAANVIRTIGERIKDFKVELGDTIIKNESFNSALSMMKDLFESESFKKGISDIVGLLAKFLMNIVGSVTAIAGLIQQSKNLKEQVTEQAEDWENSFDKIWSAMRSAGVEADKLNEALSKTKGGKQIDELAEKQKELKDRIAELNKEVERTKGMFYESAYAEKRFKKATTELNEVTAERNNLLLQGIMHITRHSEQYGISAREIEKMRKILRGAIDEQVNLDKATTGATEASQEHKAAIGQATAFIPKLKIEAKDLGIEFNSLEASTDDLNRTIETSHPEFWGVITELELIAEEANKAAKKLPWLEKAFRDFVKAIPDITGGLNELSRLSFIPEKLSKAFSGLADTLIHVASGNVLGAVVSGINFISDLFKGDEGVQQTLEDSIQMWLDYGDAAVEQTQRHIDALQVLIDKMKEASGEAQYYGNTWAGIWTYSAAMATQKQLAAEQAKKPEFYEKLTAEGLPGLRDFLKNAADNQEEWNRQVNITLAYFAMMVKSGKSVTEILQELDDVFDMLTKSQEKLGIGGSEAWEALNKFRQLIKDNKDLIDAVQGLTIALKAMVDMKAFDPSIMGAKEAKSLFDDFAKSVIDQYNDLIKAGFNQGQALLAIAPTLALLRDLAKEYGFALDKDLQNLINLADQKGLLDQEATLDTIADILREIADILGQTTGYTDQMVDDFKKMKDTLEEITELLKKFEGAKEIEINYSSPGLGNITQAQTSQNTNALSNMNALGIAGLMGNLNLNFNYPQPPITTQNLRNDLLMNRKNIADAVMDITGLGTGVSSL